VKDVNARTLPLTSLAHKNISTCPSATILFMKCHRSNFKMIILLETLKNDFDILQEKTRSKHTLKEKIR